MARNVTLFWYNVIIVGLPYKSCSWVRMSRMDMVEFHLVRVGSLETLYCAPMFASNILKHALSMFL